MPFKVPLAMNMSAPGLGQAIIDSAAPRVTLQGIRIDLSWDVFESGKRGGQRRRHGSSLRPSDIPGINGPDCVIGPPSLSSLLLAHPLPITLKLSLDSCLQRLAVRQLVRRFPLIFNRRWIDVCHFCLCLPFSRSQTPTSLSLGLNLSC
jgi:hypothetical protein